MQRIPCYRVIAYKKSYGPLTEQDRVSISGTSVLPLSILFTDIPFLHRYPLHLVDPWLDFPVAEPPFSS